MIAFSSKLTSNLMCWSFALSKTFFGISQDLSTKVTRVWRVELLANWTLLFVIPKNKLQDELWQVSVCTHFQIITCWMPLKQKMNLFGMSLWKVNFTLCLLMLTWLCGLTVVSAPPPLRYSSRMARLPPRPPSACHGWTRGESQRPIQHLCPLTKVTFPRGFGYEPLFAFTLRFWGDYTLGQLAATKLIRSDGFSPTVFLVKESGVQPLLGTR